MLVGLFFCVSLSPELGDALSALDRTRWAHLTTDASGALVAATGHDAPAADGDAYHAETRVVLSLPRSAVLGFMHVSSVVSVDEMPGEPQAVGPWCWLIDDSRRSPPRADRPRRQCLAERRAHAGRADAAQPAQRGPVREGLLPCLEGVVRRVEARGAGAQRATPLLSAAARLAAAVDVERSPRESRAPRLGGTVRAASHRAGFSRGGRDVREESTTGIDATQDRTRHRHDLTVFGAGPLQVSVRLPISE